MLPSTTSPSDSRRLINRPLRGEESSVSHDPSRESSSVSSARANKARFLAIRTAPLSRISVEKWNSAARDRRQGDSPHTWRGDSRNTATETGRNRVEERLSTFRPILVRAIPWFRATPAVQSLKPRDVRVFGERKLRSRDEATLAGRWDIGYVMLS